MTGPVRLDRRVLWKESGVELLLTRWAPKRHPATSADVSPFAVIEQMLSGTFRMRCRRGRALGDPNTVVLFNAGEDYEIEHPLDTANAGLSLRIDDGQLPGLWPVDELRSTLFRMPEARLAPRAIVGAHALVRRLTAGDPVAPLESDELLAAWIAELAPSPHCSRAGSSRRPARHVELAREFLNGAHRSRVRLPDVARAAGCTPWHLSREFARVTGVRMHQYLNSLRLRTALADLPHASDLTALALAHGFSSHSHFTAAFKREFGAAPRDLRARLHVAGN